MYNDRSVEVCVAERLTPRTYPDLGVQGSSLALHSVSLHKDFTPLCLCHGYQRHTAGGGGGEGWGNPVMD